MTEFRGPVFNFRFSRSQFSSAEWALIGELVRDLPGPYTLHRLGDVLTMYSSAASSGQRYERKHGFLTRLFRTYSAVTGLPPQRVNARKGVRFDLTKEQFFLLLLTCIIAQDERATPEAVMRKLLGLPAEGYGLLVTPDAERQSPVPAGVQPTPEQWAQLVRDVAELKQVQGQIPAPVLEDSALRSEVTALRTEVGDLRSELAASQAVVTEVAALRSEVATLRGELTTLQQALGPVEERGFEKVVMTLAILAERVDVDWEELQAEVVESLALPDVEIEE
ncbi:MAG: hypothetical protein Q4C67_10495 [Deinococcus sp.]|nr:hypothetical protein [Deinococcus sp.]